MVTTEANRLPAETIIPGERRFQADFPARLGVSGYHVAGSGEYVLGVERGSEAARAGLKQGDLILALNGCSLDGRGNWNRAVAKAVAGDGAVTVLVRDGRTGRIDSRHCTIFSPPWVR